MRPEAPTATRPTGSTAPIKVLRGRFIATASRPATAPSHTLRVKLRTNADPVTAAGATQRRLKIIKAFAPDASRVALLFGGLQMIRDHPLFGVGPQRIHSEFPRYYSGTDLSNFYYGHLE